jgi:hypothetical protein
VDKDRLTAFLFDAEGNPTGDIKIQSDSLDGQVSVQSNIANTGANGSTTIDYTSLVENGHQVRVEFERLGVWGPIIFYPQPGSTPPANYTSSPATISFGGGACSPANSSFTVDELSTRVGTNVQFTITLRDENNNTCTDVAPTLSANGEAIVGTVTPAGTAGVYTATVTDQKAETVDVAVMVNSEEVAHHTGLATANPQPITFTPGGPEVHECTPPGGTPQPASRIAIDNDQIAAVDEGNHVVTATIVDEYCNPVPGADVTWDTQTGLTPNPASKQSVTDDAGQATMTVTATAPGNYNVTAKVGALDIIHGSPAVARFGVGSCSATQSSFTVDEVEVAKGSTVTFTIVLKDIYGNTCTDAVPTLNSTSAFAVITDPVATSTPGTFTGTVLDAFVGTVYVDVKVSGVSVANFTAPATENPQPIVFLPINPTNPDSAHQDREDDGTPVLHNKPANDSGPGNTITVVWPGGATGQTTVNPDRSWSIDIPAGTIDGNATVIEQTDDGGVSGFVLVPIDITPPPTPAGHQEKKPDGTQVITNNPGSQGEPGSTITVTWPDHTTDTVVVGNDGNWTIPIPDGMPDGNAAVVATDDKGNVTPSVNIPIDVTAPDAPDSGHQEQRPDGPVVTNEPDNDAEPGTTIVITWPDGTDDEVEVKDDGSWTIPIPPGMGDGDATVVAVDPDGNESDEVKIPIDVTPPPTPGGHQEKQGDDQVITNNPGTPGEPGSTITVTWPDDTTSTTEVGQDGSWTVVIPPGMTEDGNATVVATDPEGNTSPEIKIPVDVTPPPLPAPTQDRDDEGNPILTDDKVPDFNPEPNSEIEVTWPDGTTDKVVVDEDGNWSVPIPPGTDGEASVIATDPDGNVAGPVTVVVDSIPPDPPQAEQNGEVLTNLPAIPAEPGATIVVTWPPKADGTPGGSATTEVRPDGSWVVTIPPGTDGNATVTATDPMGNVSGPIVVFIVPPMVLSESVEVTTPQDTPVYLPVLDKVSGGSNTIPLTLQSHTLPANGTITHMDGTPTNNFSLASGTKDIMHNPNKGFYGDDYLTVTVQDGFGNTIDVPVHVIVIAAPVVKTGGELISGLDFGWAVGACAIAGIAMLMVVLVANRRRKAE